MKHSAYLLAKWLLCGWSTPMSDSVDIKITCKHFAGKLFCEHVTVIWSANTLITAKIGSKFIYFSLIFAQMVDNKVPFMCVPSNRHSSWAIIETNVTSHYTKGVKMSLLENY